MLGEPCLAHVIELVAWPVVDDQEDFPAAATNDGFEELQARTRIEHGSELGQHPRFFLERDGAEDMRRLAHPVGVDARQGADLWELLVKAHPLRLCIRPGEPLAGPLDRMPEPAKEALDMLLVVVHPKRRSIRSPIIGPVQTPLV